MMQIFHREVNKNNLFFLRLPWLYLTKRKDNKVMKTNKFIYRMY